MNSQVNGQDKDQQFVDSVSSELHKSVQNISANNLSAIAETRNRALLGKAARAKTSARPAWTYAPAGIFAVTILAIVLFSFNQVPPTTPGGQDLAREHMTEKQLEIVNVMEHLDIYEDSEIYEELEFYEWLEDYNSAS